METSFVIFGAKNLSRYRENVERGGVQYIWREDAFCEDARVIQDRLRQNVDQGVSHTVASHGRGVSNRSAVHDSGNYRN